MSSKKVFGSPDQDLEVRLVVGRQAGVKRGLQSGQRAWPEAAGELGEEGPSQAPTTVSGPAHCRQVGRRVPHRPECLLFRELGNPDLHVTLPDFFELCGTRPEEPVCQPWAVRRQVRCLSQTFWFVSLFL